MAIEPSTFERVGGVFHDYLAPRRHSALLASIIIAFAIRPLIANTGASAFAFGLALVLLLLVAVYNISVDELIGERGRLVTQSRRRRRLGWVLAAAAALARSFVVFLPQSFLMNLASSVCWLLFLLFVTLSQLRSLLKQREVTGQTICLAISVYLLLGLTWTLLYGVMFQLHPDAFGNLPAPTPGHPVDVLGLLPVLGYFSLTTLSTLGFGDITPLTLQTRYAAVAEGITGQFYMAILVARLVGLQMSRPADQQASSAAAD